MKLSVSRASIDVRDEEWSALAVAAGNVFGTPEWLSTWWRHFGGRRELLAYSCRRQDGTLAGVLPLYIWRNRPLRIVRFLGHGPGDVLGPVCRRDDRPLLASALLQALEMEHAAILIGEGLPADEAWELLGDVHLLRREPSPVLTLAGLTWESFLASRSKSFRYEFGRKERRLSREHRIQYRLASGSAGFERDFQLLLELHRARWPEGSSFGQTEGFHREFADLASERGWCRLWLLEIDGHARAAWYGFRFADTEVYYQAGRDPDWDRYSLGYLLLMHSIREAASDGVSEYHFLRGGEAFKYRLATHDPGLDTMALARGAAGRAVVRALTKAPRPLLRRFARA